MIVEAIKKGDGYFIPIKGKKEKIKVFLEDEIEDVIVEHYEEKRKNYVDLKLSEFNIEKYKEKHDLTANNIDELLRILK